VQCLSYQEEYEIFLFPLVLNQKLPILYLVIIVCEKISSMSKNIHFIIGIGILKYRRGRDRMVDLWIDHYLCNQ
jgi:hypothetical protein